MLLLLFACLQSARDEDCTDGVDNDRDGLLDCEDGDCADASSCAEDCTDGVDNDGDGLLDVADEDCFAIRVDGGTLRWEHGQYPGKETYDSLGGDWERGTATAITGTLWASAQTCSWGVDAVLFERVSFSFDHSVGYFERQGFWISPDCPIQGSSFLPVEVRADRSSGQLDGTFVFPWYVSDTDAIELGSERIRHPWYIGSMRDQTTTFHDSTSIRHWTLDLSPGAPLVLPRPAP